jgi:hypothetical protein
LEVHAVLRYNYQRLLVVTKGADFLALRWNAKLPNCTVSQCVPIENTFKEPKERCAQSERRKMDGKGNLPAFLSSLFLLFFHDGGVGLLRVRLRVCVGHVDAENMDCIMVGRRRDKTGKLAELQVIYFGLVGASTEHKWTRRVL